MIKFKKALAVFIAAGGFAGLLAALAIVFFVVPPPKPARAQLSAVQTWAGAAGGTANAITLSVHNVVSLNDLLGVPIRFIPGSSSVGTTTLQVNLDGGSNLGQVSILRPTANLGLRAPSGSELQNGVLAEVTYDGTEFVVTSTVDMTPVGQSIDLRTTSTTLGYLIEDGTCYSRTTYPALFAAIGTVYNSLAPVACNGSQFAVAFANGRASVALDNQGVNTANVITAGGSGCAATGIGVICGSQNQTLLASQVPTITSGGAGNVTVSGSVSSTVSNILAGSIANGAQNFTVGGGSLFTALAQNSVGGFTITSSGTMTGSAPAVLSSSNNTGGLSHPILQPLQLVIKAVKA